MDGAIVAARIGLDADVVKPGMKKGTMS